MKLGITGSRTITDFDFAQYSLLKNADFAAFLKNWDSRAYPKLSPAERAVLIRWLKDVQTESLFQSCGLILILKNIMGGCALQPFWIAMRKLSSKQMPCLSSGIAILVLTAHFTR